MTMTQALQETETNKYQVRTHTNKKRFWKENFLSFNVYISYETREDITFLVVFQLNSLCFSFGYDQIEINYFKPINATVSIQLYDSNIGEDEIDFVFRRIRVGWGQRRTLIHRGLCINWMLQHFLKMEAEIDHQFYKILN